MGVVVNIGTINVTSPAGTGEIVGELARGVSPEALRDIGENVTEADIAIAEPAAESEASEADKVEALETAADDINDKANSRREYLRALIRDFGKQRRAGSFATTHEIEPEDRDSLEYAFEGYTEKSAAQLKRACAICPHAGSCALKNSIENWGATHFKARSDERRPYDHEYDYTPKKVEGRMKFLRRLNKNPLAHCMPERDKSLKKAA